MNINDSKINLNQKVDQKVLEDEYIIGHPPEVYGCGGVGLVPKQIGRISGQPCLQHRVMKEVTWALGSHRVA